ncbi:hypothetical protein F0161_11305 (plasmid) [Paucilactobacillus nenjiangensis]|uniref:Uncharacterized protein n=1 Tax=Paucilactobacillus nenjiangensis TaxID=1296540 RepID=A0A5P1X3J3_9LACO|nr:hypothetical protein F0161_11305 [Paucilactobacillus nenjiangensis]
MVNTILKEADLFCPNSVRINFTIYLQFNKSHQNCQFKSIHHGNSTLMCALKSCWRFSLANRAACRS